MIYQPVAYSSTSSRVGEEHTADLALVEPDKDAYDTRQYQKEPAKVELGDMLPESHSMPRRIEMECEEQEDECDASSRPTKSRVRYERHMSWAARTD